jgi:hypothetical protein
MTRGDQAVERSADKLQQTVEAWSREGGVKGKLANALADDPAFLRKLKPSLVAARARGEAPTDEKPTTEPRSAPSGPQIPKKQRTKPAGGGPSPFLIAGAALFAGIALAKWIDWRGHAHPKR